MTQTELFKCAKNLKKRHPTFNPIPSSPDTKRPVGPWKGDSYNFDRDFVNREASLGGKSNLGLLVSDDYLVLDIDNKPPAAHAKSKTFSARTGVDDFKTLCDQNEELPVTLTVRTPSDGHHYYFKLRGEDCEELLKNWSCCMNLDGKLIAVDIRKKGGYVNCPPSTKGVKGYKWTNGYSTEMAPLPKWILKNILETMTTHKPHFERQEYTSEPSLNTDFKNDDVTMFKESQWYKSFFQIGKPNTHNIINITVSEPYDCGICKRRHVKNSNHPFLVRNNGKLRFVCRSGPGFNRLIGPNYEKIHEEWDTPAKRFVEGSDHTNRAMSELLHQMVDSSVLSTDDPLEWRMFDKEEGLWRSEHRNVIMRPHLDTLVNELKELKGIYEETEKKELVKTSTFLSERLSMTVQKNQDLSALFELVHDKRKENLFDTKITLLHFTNGTMDLVTGVFGVSKAEDYATLSTKHKYIPYAEHPEEKRKIVESFLNDIMLGDADVLNYLLKALSSALDGRVEDQVFYMFLGKGANGKSLLVKLMKAALSDYYAPIPSAQVTQPSLNAQSASPALASLKSKRAAFLTELEQKVLHTEFLKMIAGGDETSGRGLYKDQTRLQLTAKVFVALNDLPAIEDKTEGFWRKLVLIPFNAHFVDLPNLPNEKQHVAGYERYLLACADTFLALLVQVYLTKYKEEGVLKKVQPATIIARGIEYQHSQNIPLQFYNVSCEAGPEVVSTQELDEAFGNFCKQRGFTKSSQLVKQMYEFLDAKHPSNARRQIKWKGKNIRGWKGFSLNNAWELVVDDVDMTDD